jgi:cephalosporin-C deacetylase-like acetyl esterase
MLVGDSRQARLIAVWAVFAAFFVLLATAWAAEAPTWESLQKVYDYPRDLKLEPTESMKAETGLWKLLSITYKSTNGETVPALLELPKSGEGPFPCVIVQHGYGGNKESMVIPFGATAAQTGIAIFGIDAQYHGERKVAGKDIFSTDLASDRKALIQTVIDLRRAVDYLRTRPDIDSTRIGYVGASMGAILGAIFGGVEPRVKAFALLVGGGNWKELIGASTIGAAGPLREEMARKGVDFAGTFADVEPLNFVGHISPRPILMLNGKQDTIVPPRCTEQLYEKANEPKRIVWYDTGHMLNDPSALTTLADWVKEHVVGKPAEDKGAGTQPAKG